MSEGAAGFGIAHTPEQVRRLRLALNTLASGSAGAALQDLARDVLSGKVELRQALQSRSYQETMTERIQAFSTWYRTLSETELQEELERAREAMLNLPESFDNTPSSQSEETEDPPHQQPVEDDDYFTQDSWLH